MSLVLRGESTLWIGVNLGESIPLISIAIPSNAVKPNASAVVVDGTLIPEVCSIMRSCWLP